MKFVETIKDLCKEHETYVSRLEKELGLGNGTIYKWDTSIPSIDKVQKVAEYFGVTVDYLLRGPEPPKPFSKQTVLELAKANNASVGQVINVLDETKAAVLDGTSI